MTQTMKCPHCQYSPMEKVTNTDGTYDCPRCQKRTHEKVEANRGDLEELAETDSPAADLAGLLLGKDNA